jgi:hypothetical protein
MNQETNRELPEMDDDLRPEYDFSRGVRGVYAHRFYKLSSDEALVSGYWQNKGFSVGSFNKKEMRGSKSPDFLLSLNGIEVAYCEVKSFQRDEWVEGLMKGAAASEVAGGLRHGPIFNRISNAVHTASTQFESVNSSRLLLNFLVMVNHDTSAGYKDLVHVLTEFEDPLNGIFDRTCMELSEGRIREEKGRIDLYLWINATRQGNLGQPSFYFSDSQTRSKVCDLLGIDPTKIRDIPPAA